MNDAPTMDADAVLRTLAELEAERSGDPHLLQAISKRFHASAEEFFPPQIDALLGHFAMLGYSDEHMLEGFAGRLNDVAGGASPRRLVRLLRNGSALRLRPEAWLDQVLLEVRGHLPNFEHGIPTLLASLAELGPQRDPELVELLLAQGLLNAGRFEDDGYFPRLFERWSRHWLPSDEAEDKARNLANEVAAGAAEGVELRDQLNLLAGLQRCGGGEEARQLEKCLEARLRAASVDDAMMALGWMRRLAVRSRPLWRACADAVELALRSKPFVRDQLPDAVHALAALSAGQGAEATEEAALVAGLLAAAETQAALPRHSASQALQMLQAACMVSTAAGQPPAKGDGKAATSFAPLPLCALATQATRLSRQLTLPGRRALKAVAEVLQWLDHGGGDQLQARLRAAQCLPAPSLPPLFDDEAKWAPVEVGAESLLQKPEEGASKRGTRFLAFGDAFAGPQSEGSPSLTPSCRLYLQALELQGWKVDVRVRPSK